MRPTDVLMAEHRVIEQVLGCLQAIVNQACSGGGLDVNDARDTIAFFRTFADRCHHAKEENHLFPALARKGLSPDSGPVAVMLEEHEMGRTSIGDMADALDGYLSSRPGAAAVFAQAAREYIELLNQHIGKEDGILFPMAGNMLNPHEQSVVLAGFEKAEEEDLGAGTHEKFLAIADRLGKKYSVKRRSEASASSFGCCGHHHHHH